MARHHVASRSRRRVHSAIHRDLQVQGRVRHQSCVQHACSHLTHAVIFLAIDALGGVVSFLSLIFEPPIDVIAAVNYLSIPACELIILLLYPLLNRGRDVSKLHEEIQQKHDIEAATAQTNKDERQADTTPSKAATLVADETPK